MGTATRMAAAWSDCQKKTSPRMSSRMRRANDRSAIQVAQTGSRKPLVSGRRKAGERPLRRTSDWETGRYVARVDSPDIKSYKWGFARATLRHVNAMTKRSVIGSSVTAAPSPCDVVARSGERRPGRGQACWLAMYIHHYGHHRQQDLHIR
jgi:hypothetical protein